MAGDELPGSRGATDGDEDRITVLVADDNERFRSGMVRALGRCDEVLVVGDVENGALALDAARDLRPDVLLVDARMPLLDGLAVTRAVRADAALKGTGVVLLSARNDQRLRDDASGAGALGCLDKSDSRRAICEAVITFAGADAVEPALDLPARWAA